MTAPPMRKAVSTDARRKLMAAAIDNMGRVRLGQHHALRSDWSARVFLENFMSLEPSGRAWMFKQIPCGAQYEQNIREIAKTAGMVGQDALSRTVAPMVIARPAFYARTASVLMQPVLAGTVLPSQTVQRLMLNPTFANWLAKAPQIKPADMASYAQRLVAVAKLSRDAQFQRDVNDYLDSLVEQVH